MRVDFFRKSTRAKKNLRLNFLHHFDLGNKSSRKAKLFVQVRGKLTTLRHGQETTRQEKGCESRQKEEVTSALFLLVPQRRLSEPAFFLHNFFGNFHVAHGTSRQAAAASSAPDFSDQKSAPSPKARSGETELSAASRGASSCCTLRQVRRDHEARSFNGR